MADETAPVEPDRRSGGDDHEPVGGPLRTDIPTDPEWADAARLPIVTAAPRRQWFRRSAGPIDSEPVGDWEWVEEWRRGAEPTPWGPGLFLATFAGLIIGCAVYVISTGLADMPWLAVAANVVVAVGLSPALWMSRSLPVLRWVGLGGAGGTVVAWISLLFFPHF